MNICRPAMAMIIKLATVDKNSATSMIKLYGIDVLHDAIVKQPTNFNVFHLLIMSFAWIVDV